MEFYTILTNIGKAKLANAQLMGETVNLVQMALGDGNGSYYEPTESQTTLVNEVWRGNINQIANDSENPNWIIIETVVPTNQGGFTIREVGVFDDDGDMIAVGKYPETYKPQLNEGAGKDLYVRMILEVSNVSSVTLKINPAVVLASRAYVDNKINEHIGKSNPHPQYNDDTENLFSNIVMANRLRALISSKKVKKPMVVMCYDDGDIRDYTTILPIHQAHNNVPGVCYIDTGTIGKPGAMTNEHLLELNDIGWEIGSHSVNHYGLGEYRVTKNVSAGATRIFVNHSNPFKNYSSSDLANWEIKESSIKEIIQVLDIGTDPTNGPYIDLVQPISNNFTTAATIMLTEDDMLYQIKTSKEHLQSLGLKVYSFAYPFNEHCAASRTMVSMFYESARASGRDPNLPSTLPNGVQAYKTRTPLRTYALLSLAIDDISTTNIDTFLNSVAANNCLGICYGHSRQANLATNVDYILTKAESLGIQIVTMHEALKTFGNLLEIGDLVLNDQSELPVNPNYLVVTHNGAVVQGGTYFTPRGINIFKHDLNNHIIAEDGMSNLEISVTGTGNLFFNIGNNISGDVTKRAIMKIAAGSRDLEFLNSGNGIILKTPDGSKRYRISVDNNGAIVTTPL